jgi:hypothetical protein
MGFPIYQASRRKVALPIWDSSGVYVIGVNSLLDGFGQTCLLRGKWIGGVVNNRNGNGGPIITFNTDFGDICE